MHRGIVPVVGLSVALALIMPVAAQPPPTVMVRADSPLGTILANAEGKTLYRFTRDQPGVSNCYDQCARTWPPLVLGEGDPMAPPELGGTLGVAARRDGSSQVTYNGMPLYYYASDANSGDTNGQGVGGVWFVVEPEPAQPMPPEELPAPNQGAPGESY